MVSETTKNLVMRLRAARDDRGLSIQELVTQTGISESTIRRVFVDDINGISGFNYEGTLAPLIDLLLLQADKGDSELTQARIDGLLAVIQLKDETIDKITRQIGELKEGQASRCAKCAEDIAFLKAQIGLKDARMDKKDEWIDQLLGLLVGVRKLENGGGSVTLK